MLLSLLPLSYIVVSNRELANTIFFFILNLQSNLQELSSVRNQQIDINIDSPRGYLALIILGNYLYFPMFYLWHILTEFKH